MHTRQIDPLPTSSEKAYLTCIEKKERKTIEFTDFAVLGKDTTSKIDLEDPFISPRHARIEKRSKGYYIADLGSKHGTFLNGCPILQARLFNNDHIELGRTGFVFTTEHPEKLDPVLYTSLNPNWSCQLTNIPRLAFSDHPVLILGPSGSGKEVLAQLLHSKSKRKTGPFVAANCSALTESLAESELFGHIRGSFTGATSDRKGAFESAKSGTLFLDEIGDLPLGLQPKLLRALEGKEMKAVGSDQTKPIDVRIIAATNQNLHQRVLSGEFRSDLFYRLNILKIEPPPLKERMEDFDQLLKYFCRNLSIEFSLKALIKLKSYSWPGNIRELRNMVFRASALFKHKMITEKDLPILIDEGVEKTEEVPTFPRPGSSAKFFLQGYEKNMIIEKLKHSFGNQREAAKELGMAKSTLNDRLKKYSIDPNLFKMK